MRRVQRAGVGRATALLLIAIGWLLAAGLPATAGPGVRLSHGAVSIDQLLFTGTSYRLPTMTVSNPGDTAATYQVSTVAMDQEALAIPSHWIVVTPAAFELAPGASQTVQASLDIPEDARLGFYEGLISAQMSSGETSDGVAGARLGAGAAATLTFEVGARTLLEAWASSVIAFWQDTGVWAYVTTGALSLGLLVVWFRRRFAIRIVAR